MKAFIVTGSSRGLGLEICKQLINRNHLIICIARNNNDSLLQLAGLESITLINNGAQVTPLGPVDSFTAEETARNVHVNLLAPIILAQSLLQQTEQWDTHGVIVNISSGSAKQPAAGMIDTDMQAVARSQERLPIASFFREAKENGALKPARDVAKKL